MIESFFKKINAVLDRIHKDDLNYFEEQFMYGHREILINYMLSNGCDISQSSYLQGGLAHGWAPNFEIWRLRKKNFQRANRYVWKGPNFSPEKVIYEQIPIGAPWLYLLMTLGIKPGEKIELPIRNNRKNLIMPFHSEGTRLKKIDEQAQFFSSIADPKESTVCLFWLDYCDPVNRKAYSDLGFSLECVGFPNRITNSFQIGSPRTFFLIHLLSLMLEHRNFITDNPSTALFYAASLGKDVIVSQDSVAKDFGVFFDSLIQKVDAKDIGSISEWLEKNYQFASSRDNGLGSLNILAWEELGFKHIKKPRELLNLDWKINSRIPDHIKDFSEMLDKTFSKIQCTSIG